MRPSASGWVLYERDASSRPRKVPMKLALPCLAVLSLALAVGCANATSVPDDADESSAELSTPSAPDLIGDIGYEQVLGPVAYAQNAPYRAYRFHGTAGDRVRAVVKGTGVPAAWILDASFATLTSGLGSASTHSVFVTKTLPSTGTFYVAFRDGDRHDATFSVSLARTDVLGPSPGITVLDDRSRVDCMTRPLLAGARLDRLKELATDGVVVLGYPWKTDYTDGHTKGAAVVRLRFDDPAHPSDYVVEISEVGGAGSIEFIDDKDTCKESSYYRNSFFHAPATNCWSDRNTASTQVSVARDGCVSFQYAAPDAKDSTHAHFAVGLTFDIQ